MIFIIDIVDDTFNKLSSRISVDIKNLKLLELIKKPITVGINTSLLKTRKILLENKIKRVIVVDKRKPIGVITEKDIAQKFDSKITLLTCTERETWRHSKNQMSCPFNKINEVRFD